MGSFVLKEVLKEFLGTSQSALICEKARRGKDHLVVSYSKLVEHDPRLAEAYVDCPDEFLSLCQDACKEVASSLTPVQGKFTLRIKNLPKSTFVDVAMLRHGHLGKLVTVEGRVKQKSFVRPRVNKATFECPNCGSLMNTIQTSEKWQEPQRCQCGRKGKFKVISKDLSDVFSMLVEEPTETASGGTRLASVRVLCSDDLTNGEVERKVYQGRRVRVHGVLKEAALVDRHGLKTNQLDIFVDANYVKVLDDTYDTQRISEEELVKIRALADNPDRLTVLAESMYGTIYGHDIEKTALILSLIGGVTKTVNHKRVRGDIHLLLVGDPGSAKTDLLKLTQAHAVKSMFASGRGMSAVGLTASVERDELLGGFTLQAGILPLCHDGHAFIDELDKVNTRSNQSGPENNLNALHEGMEQGTVTVNKASIHATLMAEATVIAAANPKRGMFDSYDILYDQIALPSTLINRFDLVFPFRTETDLEKNKEVALRIIRRSMGDCGPAPELDVGFIVKYVAACRRVNPVIEDALALSMGEWYARTRADRTSPSSNNRLPITPRLLEALIRISTAHARSRLSEVVQEVDFAYAKNLLQHFLVQVAGDPVTGAVDEMVFETSMSRSQSETIRLLVTWMDSRGKEVGFDEILKYLEDTFGLDERGVDKVLMKAVQQGIIYEPKRLRYRVI